MSYELECEMNEELSEIEILELRLDQARNSELNALIAYRKVEIDRNALRKQLDMAVWKIKSASRLLEALRMDSGVGNILSEPVKDLYKSIEQDLQETLKRLEE